MSSFRFIAIAVTLFMVSVLPARAQDTLDQEELLTDAGYTLQRFAANEQMPAARTVMRRAKAILVFPSLIKGAFFLGGEGGSGVLLVRQDDGSWSYPAFYTLGSVSFGLQIGGQSSQAIMLVMNDHALQALMDDQVKLGGDLSAAVGPVGTGVEASATTAMSDDIYTYSTNSGLFIGASFEGAVLARREDWNGDFYNGVTDPRAIVLNGQASNPKADPLRMILNNHAKPE
jgi:lipid-binding SYLF domain-containing protein